MRSSHVVPIRGLALLISAMLLSCALAPLSAEADEGGEDIAPLTSTLVSTRTVALPATSLSEARAATITSGTVELAIAGDGTGDQPIPTVRTTYVVRGCAYSFDREAGAFALVNAANAELTEEGYLIVPASLVLDGTTYPVRSIEPCALSETRALLVALSSEIEKVSEEAAAGCGILQAVYVSPDNETYSSYDGCLYDQPQTSLLLIPEGKQGAVRIAPSAENVDPEEFSHCPSIGSLSADAGSAAFSSRNALPYDEDDDGASLGGIADDGGSDLGSGIDEAPASGDAAAGQPLYGESGEPIDIDSVVIDEGAFAPITLPSDNDQASADADSVDGEDGAEGDADSTASPSGPTASDAFSMRIVDAVPRDDLPQYAIYFRANGGEAGSVPSTQYSNRDGSMPDISGSYGEAHKPRRSNYVFMGFYDGSDYAKATRYYNADFTQDDACKTGYDFGADGLILYAGWAPMIKVDVPAQVTILSGTEEWDGPQAAKGVPIRNYSPYEVVCSYLEWDDAKVDDGAHGVDHIFSTMTERSDPALSPAPEVVDASSTHGLHGDGGVFSDGDRIALRISLSSDTSKTGAVTPGSSTALAQDIGHIRVAAAEDAKTPSVERFDYAIDVEDGARVQVGEAVSNTTLISRFEASSVGAPAAKAAVMFDQNGCDDAGYFIKSIEETYGADAGARASLRSGYDGAFTAPARYGYIFKGYYDDPVWNRVEDGELVAHRYFDEQGRPVGTWDKTSATVLYAGWENEKCTIVFDANGGYFDDDPSMKRKVYSNIDFGSTLAEVLGADGLPTAEYRIDGTGRAISRSWWTERAGGEDLSVLGLQNVAVDSLEPITFYAHWNDDSMPLSVTLDANGGHFGDDPAATESTISTTIGAALGDAAAASPENPGFTLLGWALEPAGEVIEQTPPVVGALTLYAQWQANDITVTWDKGTWGSDGPLLEPFACTYAKGTTLGVHVPADPLMDRGAGFAFEGFYLTDEDGDKVEGSRATGTTPLPTASTTYTAFWGIDIAYDCNGGAIGGETTLTRTQASGGTKAIELPAEPVREGYDFVGWFTSAADDATRIDAGFRPVAPATYVAHWAGKRIEVMLDANGGAFADGKRTKTISGTAGSAVTWPAAPTREGYAFDGWCTDAACTVAAPSTMPTANATYCAKWKGATITIKWDSRGGSAVADTSAAYGPDAKVPLPADPTRDGYDFVEWNTEPDGTGARVDASTALPSAMTTYYAKWAPYEYTIVFNTNSGSGTVPGEQTIVWGEAGYAIPSSTELENEGGPWLGWALDDKAKKPDFDKHATITGQALCEANGNELHPNGSTITLYAVYRLVMNPKDELEAGEEGFYLDLTTSEANRAGLPAEAVGYYYAEDIKAAADDIAEKASDSEYFDMFNRIMQNDVQFTTRWNYYTYNNSATPIQRTSTTGASPIPYKVRIIGIDHDDLTTPRTAEDGSMVTKAGLTFQFVDLLYNAYQMNEAIDTKAWCTNPDRRRYPYNHILHDTATGNNSNAGGWGRSELRANMNPGTMGTMTNDGTHVGTEQQALLANNHDTDAVWDLAPDKLKDSLSQVQKRYYAGTDKVKAGGTPSISNDWMFIPSYSEMVASGYYSGWGNLAGEGDTYWYYKNAGVKGNAAAVKGPGDPSGGASADTAYVANKCLLKFHILEDGSIDRKILESTYGNGGDFGGWTQGYQWVWWERSSSPTHATNFTSVNADGIAYNNGCSSIFLGVAPCFCF